MYVHVVNTIYIFLCTHLVDYGMINVMMQDVRSKIIRRWKSVSITLFNCILSCMFLISRIVSEDDI